MPGTTEYRQPGQVLDRCGVGDGGGDDRRVGKDPARRDVAPAGDILTRQPQFTHRCQPASALDRVNATGPAPPVDAGRGCRAAQHRGELLTRPLVLTGVGKRGGGRVAQFDEHLHVEGGVHQPVMRQRTPRPVRRAVPLAEPQTQKLLDHRGQIHLGFAEQTSGQFGVEEGCAHEPRLTQTRQVLVGGMEHPLGSGQHLDHRGQGPGFMRGIEKERARTGTFELDQVGTL